MNKTIRFLTIMMGFFALPVLLSAQCTPGDETSCPDLEGNGEICPETLPNAVIDQPYSQEFTILAPPTYEYQGLPFDLHHITLKSIDNMPPGITWESNAPDSVFMVGTYYCVLLEGTASEKGIFPLRIVIDVYIPGIGGSDPIKVATVTDSTSLSISVTDPSGIGDLTEQNLSQLNCSPNPFTRDFELTFRSREPEDVTVEVHTLMGQLIVSEPHKLQTGENSIALDGSGLLPGIYFVSIRNSRGVLTHRMVKSN
jgi:hypothetical protein